MSEWQVDLEEREWEEGGLKTSIARISYCAVAGLFGERGLRTESANRTLGQVPRFLAEAGVSP